MVPLTTHYLCVLTQRLDHLALQRQTHKVSVPTALQHIHYPWAHKHGSVDRPNMMSVWRLSSCRVLFSKTSSMKGTCSPHLHIQQATKILDTAIWQYCVTFCSFGCAVSKKLKVGCVYSVLFFIKAICGIRMSNEKHQLRLFHKQSTGFIIRRIKGPNGQQLSLFTDHFHHISRFRPFPDVSPL